MGTRIRCRNALCSSRVKPPRASSRRKPPPAGPVRGPSTTNAVKSAARRASTAFPPASSTSAPARALNGWPAAIAPFIRGAYFGARRRSAGRAGPDDSRRTTGGAASARAQEGRQLGVRLAARGLARRELGRRRTTFHPAETGRDDGDPDLAGEPRVDRGAEDDVRLVRRGLTDDLGRLVHLDER